MSEAAPRKRLFEAGQMKILVLHLIAQAPKFSYDIIKDVANLVGGNYKPSTGTICPTLNYLEQQQYTRVEISPDERKQYHITPQGLIHLQDHQSELDKIFERFNTRSQIQNNSEFLDIKRAMENLKVALRLKIQHENLTQAQVRTIAEKIDQAAVEITHLANQEVSQ
ncbi:PadR family transcriptional regulator [Acinetobacter sp. B51(2017)]|uniref:PadR family transcriptional regulator n=1 Tax=Acinetobacter sp. B51(2017) TaxID=2060938 RepID=UPI000F0788A3|nr:PadR family transcriptional regulator [Acinetobacter sp. B51(2017)]